jgi:hypothetical protein
MERIGMGTPFRIRAEGQLGVKTGGLRSVVRTAVF